MSRDKYAELVKPRLAEIGLWAEAGSTNTEIAATLGLHSNTFLNHRRRHPELAEALKKGRAAALPAIRAALFDRALGATQERITYDGEGKLKERTVTKLPPNVYALNLLLKNWDSSWSENPALLALKQAQVLAGVMCQQGEIDEDIITIAESGIKALKEGG